MPAPTQKAATVQAATIHVVDDDAAVRDSIVFLLETAGHTVRAHATATACLDTAPATEVGCVITDVQMPEIDGLDFQLAYLKAWLGFIGVTQADAVRVAGTFGPEDVVAAAMAQAFTDADQLADAL